MLVHAVNEDLVIEDVPEKKPFKRRVVVASLLALAAFGAHQLHGRMQPASQQELTISRAVSTVDSTDRTVSGPNSLFGDAVVDHKFDAPVSNSFASCEMATVGVVDEAALDRLASPTIEGLDWASFKQADIAAGSIVPSDISTSAVPEPTTAGLLLLVAAPVIGRRRQRNRGSL